MGTTYVWDLSNMRETLYETVLQDTSPQMECTVAAHVQLLTSLYDKAPHYY